MSFILDALKKSETDRQQQASAEFSKVPTGDHTPRAPRWLWVLGGLLAINLVVLLGLFLRSDDGPAVAAVAGPAAESGTLRSTPGAEPAASFEERIEEARRNAPQRLEAPAPSPKPPAEAEPARTANPVPTTRRESQTATLPTFYQVVSSGMLTLPDLHLDIHVYSETPEDRFVFINMSKQRENSQLREGPTVEEITPEGVVLEYRGTTFLLPRD